MLLLTQQSQNHILIIIYLGLKFFIDFFINIHYNKLLGTTDDITDDITDDNITKDNDILLSST